MSSYLYRLYTMRLRAWDEARRGLDQYFTACPGSVEQGLAEARIDGAETVIRTLLREANRVVDEGRRL
jgi:hypothetical protein